MNSNGHNPALELNAECVVLSLLLHGSNREILEIAEPEDFLADPHKVIFSAIQELCRNGHPHDWASVAELLEERGELQRIGRLCTLASLAESVALEGAANEAIRLIAERANLRREKTTSILQDREAAPGASDGAQAISQVSPNQMNGSTRATMRNAVIPETHQEALKASQPIAATRPVRPWPEWLDLATLTEYAPVSERTARSWIRATTDPLPASRVGGKILVRRSEFDSWLERHRVKPVDLSGMVEEIVQAVTHGH